MVMSSSCTAEQLEVCEEAYLYLMHLLVAVGAIPRSAATPDNAANKPPGQDAQDPPGREDSSASDATTPAKMRAASAAAAAAYCPDLHKDNFHPDAFQGMPIRAMSHARLMARRELLGQVRCGRAARWCLACPGLPQDCTKQHMHACEQDQSPSDHDGCCTREPPVHTFCTFGQFNQLLLRWACATATRVMVQVTGLVRALVDAGKAYKDTAATVAEAAGSKAAKAAASTRARAIDRLCMALHGTARCMTQVGAVATAAAGPSHGLPCTCNPLQPTASFAALLGHAVRHKE